MLWQWGMSVALVALVCAVYGLLRSGRRAAQQQDLQALAVVEQCARLEALIQIAQKESERLERAIRRAEMQGVAEGRAVLGILEALADPEALADQAALSRAAADTPLPCDVSPDLFERDERSLAVARLADQGLAPGAIARRLGFTVGEVELLLSLRSVS